MIEGIFANVSLAQWNTFLGASAALLTIIIGLIGIRKKLFTWLYLAPKNYWVRKQAERDKLHAERIFEEIQSMLEQEIMDTLEGYTSVMHEQGITIASAIAENVEFKNYVTRSMSILHDTMTKIANAVELNACDAKLMRDRLNAQACDDAGICDKRIFIKPCDGGTEGENDES